MTLRCFKPGQRAPSGQQPKSKLKKQARRWFGGITIASVIWQSAFFWSILFFTDAELMSPKKAKRLHHAGRENQQTQAKKARKEKERANERVQDVWFGDLEGRQGSTPQHQAVSTEHKHGLLHTSLFRLRYLSVNLSWIWARTRHKQEAEQLNHNTVVLNRDRWLEREREGEKSQVWTEIQEKLLILEWNNVRFQDGLDQVGRLDCDPPGCRRTRWASDSAKRKKSMV